MRSMQWGIVAALVWLGLVVSAPAQVEVEEGASPDAGVQTDVAAAQQESQVDTQADVQAAGQAVVPPNRDNAGDPSQTSPTDPVPPQRALEAEADVQRYLWLMVLFGSHWERDPQVQWTAAVLAPAEGTTPSERIGKLWEQAQAWRHRVRGPNDTQYQAALRSIEGKSLDDLCKNPSRSQRDLLIQLASMWPSKVAEVGDQSLYDLTRLAVDACKPFELMDRWAVVLFAELMFLFGVGFVLDPLYPWAAEALAARPGDSVDQKLERLLIAMQRFLMAR